MSFHTCRFDCTMYKQKQVLWETEITVHWYTRTFSMSEYPNWPKICCVHQAHLNILCTRLETNFMKASWSGLLHLEVAAGEGETGDFDREDGGGAGDRPRPGLRPRTRWRRQVSVIALSSAPSSLLSSCCSRVCSLPTAKERRACN